MEHADLRSGGLVEALPLVKPRNRKERRGFADCGVGCMLQVPPPTGVPVIYMPFAS